MSDNGPINVQQNCYTIFDSKAEAYHFPFLARNDETAVRMILARATQEGNDLNTFSADFTLFYLGVWHDGHGRLDQVEAFKNLGNVAAIVAAYNRTEDVI